jgi:hypothetical protein
MDSYFTSDLYLAGYLKAHGLVVIDYARDRQDPRRVNFSFEESPQRKELHRAFYNGGMVEIRGFINAIKDLKSLTRNI